MMPTLIQLQFHHIVVRHLIGMNGRAYIPLRYRMLSSSSNIHFHQILHHLHDQACMKMVLLCVDQV